MKAFLQLAWLAAAGAVAAGGCAGVITDTLTVPVPGEKVFVVTSEPLAAAIVLNDRQSGSTPNTIRWSPALAVTRRAVLLVRKEGHLDASVTFDFEQADPLVSKSDAVTVSRKSEPMRDIITVRAVLRLTEVKAYEQARGLDTVAAYEQFAREYPAGVLVAEARRRVAEALFAEAAARNSADAYRQFLADPRSGENPDGRREAQRRVERLSFEAARRTNTHAAYRAFLAEHAERSEYGTLAADALRRIEADYGRRMAAGASLSLQGNLDEAIREYQEAARAWPERSEPFHDLAVLHLQHGDRALAQQSIREALRRSPRNADYQRLLDQIRNARP